MSKILTGSKIQLARGFSDGESKKTQEKYMSLATEREILIKRRNASLEVIETYKESKDKKEKGKLNAAQDEYTKVTGRLRKLNEIARERANLSQLILDRLKQYVPKEDWLAVVKMAKLEQQHILSEISGWE